MIFVNHDTVCRTAPVTQGLLINLTVHRAPYTLDNKENPRGAMSMITLGQECHIEHTQEMH